MHTSISPDLMQNYGCRELLNSLADGVYITDTDRRILFWNRAAERITGWLVDEVVGHSCQDDILVHIDKDGHQLCGREHCPLYRSILIDQPSSKSLLVYALSKSGNRVPVEVTGAPIHDSAGRVVGGIELFRDVTPDVADMLRARMIQQTFLECGLAPDDLTLLMARRVS